MADEELLSDKTAERIFERDREEFALGDTLDIKTSIALVLLTFLATQTDSLMYGMASKCLVELWLLRVGVAALICGGASAVLELWPRDYKRESTPDKYSTWREKLLEYYKNERNPHATAFNHEQQVRIDKACTRISVNFRLNKLKSHYMLACFICVTVAFALNLLVLATRLF